MGSARFLYDNLLTAATMLSVSSLRPGIVTSALKEGTGAASLSTGGAYTGTRDREYTVEIDSIAAGAEIGQATFRWSDGSGSWNAAGVITSASDISLNNGLTVRFTAGAGDDFALGDKWYFKGINLFGVDAMVDWDRDHRYRSAALQAPNTITVDFGTPREVEALILGDHNLSAAATIAIKGNTADSWGSPSFAESVTWNAGRLIHYLSSVQSFRFWRIEISDAANADGHMEIGEVFLGPYMEPSVNYSIGSSRDIAALTAGSKTPYGVERRRFFNLQRTFRYAWEMVPRSDMDAFEAMFAAITDRSTGVIRPFWFNEDSAYPNDTWLVAIAGMPRRRRVRDHYDCELSMTEVMASV